MSITTIQHYGGSIIAEHGFSGRWTAIVVQETDGRSITSCRKLPMTSPTCVRCTGNTGSGSFAWAGIGLASSHMARCNLTYVSKGEYLEARPIELMMVRRFSAARAAAILALEEE